MDKISLSNIENIKEEKEKKSEEEDDDNDEDNYKNQIINVKKKLSNLEKEINDREKEYLSKMAQLFFLVQTHCEIKNDIYQKFEKFRKVPADNEQEKENSFNNNNVN